MARPRKEGLEYFSLDTCFDENLETLIAAHGNDGLAFMLRWWQQAYATGTGEVSLASPVSRARLAERVRVKEARLMSIAQTAAELGLVDPERWSAEKVLTSNGVKKRLELIQKKRIADRSRIDSREGFRGDNPPDNDGENGGKGKGKGNSLLKESAREASAGSRQPRAPEPTRPERRRYQRDAAPSAIGDVLGKLQGTK